VTGARGKRRAAGLAFASACEASLAAAVPKIYESARECLRATAPPNAADSAAVLLAERQLTQVALESNPPGYRWRRMTTMGASSAGRVSVRCTKIVLRITSTMKIPDEALWSFPSTANVPSRLLFLAALAIRGRHGGSKTRAVQRDYSRSKVAESSGLSGCAERLLWGAWSETLHPGRAGNPGVLLSNPVNVASPGILAS